MLKRIFPEMTDHPEKAMFLPVILYGFIAFIMLPVVVMMLTNGVWSDTVTLSWMELVYHLLNTVIAVAMFKSYMGESFFNVQLYTKKFVKTVAIATLVMLTVALEIQFFLGISVGNAFPINELSITVSSGRMVQELPLWGTLYHTLVAPFAIAGLFYATGFATFCCKKPWLGYLVVSLALIIPGALDINWRGGGDMVMGMYFLRLPIHLIACWSYHKADTIWAPITCLAIFNLATSLLCLLPM